MSATGSRRNRAPRARDVRDQLSEVESMLGRAAKQTGEKASTSFSQAEAKLRSATFAWIEGWYNLRRRHSTLGGVSPANYEKNRQHVAAQAA